MIVQSPFSMSPIVSLTVKSNASARGFCGPVIPVGLLANAYNGQKPPQPKMSCKRGYTISRERRCSIVREDQNARLYNAPLSGTQTWSLSAPALQGLKALHQAPDPLGT